MKPTSGDVEHRRMLRSIDAHFEGRISVSAEAEMRAHLPSCHRCREEYERRLVVARLDPRAAPAHDRMTYGLGFSPPRSRRWSLWAITAGVPVAAAAGITLVLAWAERPRLAPLEDPSGFVSRVSRSGEASAPIFWTYRLDSTGHPSLVGSAIDASDELAFAYSNAVGGRYLVIVAVDEYGHVFWFHPAWPKDTPAPRSMPAALGPGPHELGQAIRHDFDGRRLDLYAILSSRQLEATEVEERIRRAVPGPLTALDGETISHRTLEVRR